MPPDSDTVTDTGTVTLEIVEIGPLSHYNQDEEANPPAPWTAFREKIRSFDAVLFATPEYNRSVPGFLKNAIDIGSRPHGKSVWDGKPGAVVSVAPGALSAFGANHHLRQSLVLLNLPAMQQPEAYIGGADKLSDAEGKLTNDSTQGFPDEVHAGVCRLDRDPAPPPTLELSCLDSKRADGPDCSSPRLARTDGRSVASRQNRIAIPIPTPRPSGRTTGRTPAPEYHVSV
jgi:chromate reductase